MKVALITTSPSVRSGIGDYTRHLLPYLRERCEVRVFVEPGAARGELEGVPMASVDELDPREHDRLLYQLGNEQSHAFMPRMIRAIGGTVMQHDWVLFDLAVEAFPALARGGLKGHALAMREGGAEQLRVYSRNWLDRRRQRTTRQEPGDCDELEGTLLCGWHEHQGDGRWTSDVACVRLPAEDASAVEVELHAEGNRVVRLCEGDRPLTGPSRQDTLRADFAERRRPLLKIETQGITVTREQRRHGDARRLGSFVRHVRWKENGAWRELDLSQPVALPIDQITLARDRFQLPLNRSVVRFGDAFIVHSNYVAERILRERNSRTPIGIVHHGSEKRWHDEDRRETRRRLGLSTEWIESFLIVSFGGVQPHKRVDKVLEAVAEARRERDDVRLVLAGKKHAEGFDPEGYARELGIADATHFTGFVEEREGWDWMHAGDVGVNLRGPTSGGTSGGIFQSLGQGRPVLASNAGEQRELPDSCTVKVPVGVAEVETLAQRIVELRDDPARLAELEAGARRFVEEECHWSHTAAKYVEYLDSFPGPRATRKGLLALGIERQRQRAQG